MSPLPSHFHVHDMHVCVPSLGYVYAKNSNMRLQVAKVSVCKAVRRVFKHLHVWQSIYSNHVIRQSI